MWQRENVHTELISSRIFVAGPICWTNWSDRLHLVFTVGKIEIVKGRKASGVGGRREHATWPTPARIRAIQLCLGHKKHSAHGSLYRTGVGPVQGFLEGLTNRIFQTRLTIDSVGYFYLAGRLMFHPPCSTIRPAPAKHMYSPLPPSAVNCP
jgi:hypothetical protein